MIALKRDELAILTGGESIAFPPWVDWLVWLGQWMRIQADLEGRRVAVVRMPSRRLAAAFTAIGSVFASARLHDDSLDWEGLRSLAPGTKIFWRESAPGKSLRRAGRVVGVCQLAGSDVLEVEIEAQKKAQQGKRFFAKAGALSYGITLGLVSALADERLAGAESAIKAALTDAPHGWIRSPGIECSIITERTSFLSDLGGLDILAGGGAQASCIDILAIADPGGMSHGKTRVAPPRSDGVLDESGSITILDGAASARRMSDSIARSVVVLLDQAEYDEEVEQLLQTYLGYAVDAGVHQPAIGFMAPPASVECFIFGLPLQPQSNI
ncbi:MAG: hypothetical protein ACK4F6_06995 [Hylemonella sp.]